MHPRSRTEISLGKLGKMFRPASVAIVGVSPGLGTGRNSIGCVLQQTGYAGTINLVGPRHKEIEGLVCYKDVTQLPDRPDLALVITPNHTVASIIAQRGEAAIPAAIVFSSGLEEMDGGKAMAKEVRAAADQHGIAMLGTNCQGAWSSNATTILSFGASPAIHWAAFR